MNGQKLDDILAEIGKARWTLREFLHHLFAEPKKTSGEEKGDHKPEEIPSQSDSHWHYVTKFLSGSTEYSP